MLERTVEVANQQIKVKQRLDLSHAGTVWDGALILISYLDYNTEKASTMLKGKTILEVGSGTGITGLATIAFEPKHVYLTDLPEYVSLIQENI